MSWQNAWSGLKRAFSNVNRTIPAVFEQQAAARGHNPLFFVKRQGAYQPISWQEAHADVQALSAFLLSQEVIVGDRILIQHQEQPFRGSFISLPGGFREADDPLDDAKRELLEESGYASERWVHYLSWSPPASKLIWKNHFYIAHDCKKIQEMIPDPGEKITLVFIDFDTFLLMADNPTWRHRDLVPTLLRARYEPDKRRALEEALFG